MKTYNSNEVKKELEEKLLKIDTRQYVYKKALEVYYINKGKNVSKRLENDFKKEMENNKYNLYVGYHTTNDGYENKKYLYVCGDNYFNEEIILERVLKWDNQETMTFDEMFENQCKNAIKYQKEQKEKINNALEIVDKEVEKFNNIMENLEKWQENNDEVLKYILKVKEY